MSNYEVRQCSEKSCTLRFPIGKSHPQGHICPRCGAPTHHKIDIDHPETEQIAFDSPMPSTVEQPLILEVLLDNIRSLLNVGAIFRSADGVGVRHLHLCGITPTPENPKLQKTALGAENVVPWTQNLNGLEAAQCLQNQGHHIWALESPSSLPELSDKSSESAVETDLFSIYDLPNIKKSRPITLVVGNEVTGIDPHILALCDAILYIPMQGLKQSLNVATATGIALYMLAATASRR